MPYFHINFDSPKFKGWKYGKLILLSGTPPQVWLGAKLCRAVALQELSLSPIIIIIIIMC